MTLGWWIGLLLWVIWTEYVWQSSVPVLLSPMMHCHVTSLSTKTLWMEVYILCFDIMPGNFVSSEITVDHSCTGRLTWNKMKINKYNILGIATPAPESDPQLPVFQFSQYSRVLAGILLCRQLQARTSPRLDKKRKKHCFASRRQNLSFVHLG